MTLAHAATSTASARRSGLLASGTAPQAADHAAAASSRPRAWYAPRMSADTRWVRRSASARQFVMRKNRANMPAKSIPTRRAASPAAPATTIETTRAGTSP